MPEAASTREAQKESLQSVSKYLLQWAEAYKGRLSVSEPKFLSPLDRTHFREREEIEEGLTSLTAMVSEFVEGSRYSSRKTGVNKISSPVPTSEEELGITHTETFFYLEVPSPSGKLPTNKFKEQVQLRAREPIGTLEGVADQTFEGAVAAQMFKIKTDTEEGKRSNAPDFTIMSAEKTEKDLKALRGAHLAEYELTCNLARWDEGSEAVVVRKTAGVKVVFCPEDRVVVSGVVYPGGIPVLFPEPLVVYTNDPAEAKSISEALNQLTSKAAEKAETANQRRRF